MGVGWGATQTRRQERRNKPTLKNRPKGTPRPVVNPNDLEKPIIPDPWNPEKDSTSALLDKAFKFVGFLQKTVKFVGFSKDQELEIETRLFATILIKSCIDAFKALPGLKATPGQVMRDRGITFVNATVMV